MRLRGSARFLKLEPRTKKPKFRNALSCPRADPARGERDAGPLSVRLPRRKDFREDSRPARCRSYRTLHVKGLRMEFASGLQRASTPQRLAAVDRKLSQ